MALATSLAVIAFPLAKAARTAPLVAPDAVRAVVPFPAAAADLAGCEDVGDAGVRLAAARARGRAVDVRRRERGALEPS